MRYTLLISILLLIVISCKKTKFSTTPSLKLESVNHTVLHTQDLLTFKLSFTDAEGDFGDSSQLFIQDIVPNCPASSFSQINTIPVFPSSKDQKGELTVTFEYNGSGSDGYTSIPVQCQESDTAIFRFALRDAALHVSDTVSSPPIIFVYP